MHGDEANTPDAISVVCHICKARFEAPARDEPTQAKCPDCFSPVQVPAAEQQKANRPTAYQPADSGGVYSISTGTTEESPQRPPKPKRPKVAVIHCAHCGAELTPEVRDRAYNITCPECLEVTEVPVRPAVSKNVPKKPQRNRPQPESPPAAPEPVAAPQPQPSVWSENATPDAGQTTVYDRMAEYHREELPDPPNWTFFSNVFQLPWRRDALTQWIYISVGCMIAGFFIALIHWIITDGIIIAVPFFVLPTFFAVMWTGSFAVSRCLTVLEDTANGNDRIHGWNDGGWRETAADAIPPVLLAGLAAAAAFGIGNAAVHGIGMKAFGPAFGVTMCLLYPVMLLSSLQAGTVSVPLTWSVLKSLVVHAAHWFVFYALILLVAAAYALPVYFGLRGGYWFTTLMLTGPLLASAILISGRLMGRLAWRTLVREDDDETEGPESQTPGGKQKHRGRRKKRKPGDNAPTRARTPNQNGEHALHRTL